jgi:hypothetical protein
VTEAEARAALRAFVAVDDLEQWIAAQPWEVTVGGWTVPPNLCGWRFRVEPAPGGLRVVMSGAGGEPAAWLVPGQV